MRAARVVMTIVLVSLVGALLATPTSPVQAQVEGNAYTSPSYGYRLAWGEATWSVEEDETPDDENDYLGFYTEVSALRVVGFETDGDAADCLEAAPGEIGLRPGTELEPLADADGAPIAGVEPDRAFAAYAFTVPDGNAERAYVECRELVPGQAVLVFTFIAAADEYEEGLDGRGR